MSAPTRPRAYGYRCTVDGCARTAAGYPSQTAAARAHRRHTESHHLTAPAAPAAP